jgi:hypothetical protein
MFELNIGWTDKRVLISITASKQNKFKIEIYYVNWIGWAHNHKIISW